MKLPTPWSRHTMLTNNIETQPHKIGGWECERDSDCSFLSGGAERGW